MLFFWGYLENHKAHRSSKKIIISRHVKFEEDIFSSIKEDNPIDHSQYTKDFIINLMIINQEVIKLTILNNHRMKYKVHRIHLTHKSTNELSLQKDNDNKILSWFQQILSFVGLKDNIDLHQRTRILLL